MIRIDIPARFLVHCRYCHEPLNSTGKGIYHRGTAWFKQQTTGNHAAGLNSASMVEWSREWCCVFCMKKLMSNIPVEQMQLFITEDDSLA